MRILFFILNYLLIMIFSFIIGSYSYAETTHAKYFIPKFPTCSVNKPFIHTINPSHNATFSIKINVKNKVKVRYRERQIDFSLHINTFACCRFFSISILRNDIPDFFLQNQISFHNKLRGPPSVFA